MDTRLLVEEKEMLHDRATRLPATQAGGILQSIAAIVIEAVEGVDDRLVNLQKHLAMVELANELTRLECQLNTPVH